MEDDDSIDPAPDEDLADLVWDGSLTIPPGDLSASGITREAMQEALRLLQSDVIRGVSGPVMYEGIEPYTQEQFEAALGQFATSPVRTAMAGLRSTTHDFRNEMLADWYDPPASGVLGPRASLVDRYLTYGPAAIEPPFLSSVVILDTPVPPAITEPAVPPVQALGRIEELPMRVVIHAEFAVEVPARTNWEALCLMARGGLDEAMQVVLPGAVDVPGAHVLWCDTLGVDGLGAPPSVPTGVTHAPRVSRASVAALYEFLSYGRGPWNLADVEAALDVLSDWTGTDMLITWESVGDEGLVRPQTICCRVGGEARYVPPAVLDFVIGLGGGDPDVIRGVGPSPDAAVEHFVRRTQISRRTYVNADYRTDRSAAPFTPFTPGDVRPVPVAPVTTLAAATDAAPMPEGSRGAVARAGERTGMPFRLRRRDLTRILDGVSNRLAIDLFVVWDSVGELDFLGGTPTVLCATLAGETRYAPTPLVGFLMGADVTIEVLTQAAPGEPYGGTLTDFNEVDERTYVAIDARSHDEDDEDADGNDDDVDDERPVPPTRRAPSNEDAAVRAALHASVATMYGALRRASTFEEASVALATLGAWTSQDVVALWERDPGDGPLCDFPCVVRARHEAHTHELLRVPEFLLGDAAYAPADLAGANRGDTREQLSNYEPRGSHCYVLAPAAGA